MEKIKTELNPGVWVGVFPLRGLPLTSGCGLVGSVEIGPSFSRGGWSFLLRVRVWPFLLEVDARLFLLGAAGWPFFLMVGYGLPPWNGGRRIRLGVRSGPPFSVRAFATPGSGNLSFERKRFCTIGTEHCHCYKRQPVRVRMSITSIASSDQVLHLHLFLCEFGWHVFSGGT